MAFQLPPETSARPLRDSGIALAVCAAVTVLALPLVGIIDVSNVAMFFLLGVVLVAVKLGRGPAVLASVASVALFDFFFVEPRFSFAVQDAQYLVTFGVMLVVALVISELAARARLEAIQAKAWQSRTQALYDLARELSAASSIEQVASITDAFVAVHLGARSALFVPGRDGKLASAVAGEHEQGDLGVETRVFETGKAMPFISHGRGDASIALPLKTPVSIRGTMVISSRERGVAVRPSDEPNLEAIASLVAIVVERLLLIEPTRGIRLNN
jgi:two-component system sensor histidine kinase KdpD